MATILAGRGGDDAFADHVVRRWGFAPPPVGHARFGARGGLIGTAPAQWLAVASSGASLVDLPDLFRGLAAVSTQGDGRALVEIDGPQARRMLAKVLSIDLHPDVFTPGRAATTALAHQSVLLWCDEDPAALTLCVARTLAASLWRVLLASAAEYGVIVE